MQSPSKRTMDKLKSFLIDVSITKAAFIVKNSDVETIKNFIGSTRINFACNQFHLFNDDNHTILEIYKL